MNFKQIRPQDYSALERYFKNQPHKLCSYSLSSILVWSNDQHKPFGAIVGDKKYEDGETLIVSVEFSAPQKENHLILPISPTKTHSPKELSELAKTLGFKKISFITEEQIKKFGRPAFEDFFDIVEDEKYNDYVYLQEDLAHLKGKNGSKKRNLIKQFEKKFVSTNRVSIEPITPENAAECLDFLNIWCKQRDCDADPKEDMACEKEAAEKALANIDTLGFTGILLRLDRVVSAFGIGSTLTMDMGALHFEKASASIKGLYQYFDRECARHLFNGLKYINKESDMGIEGLAKAKKSYHPIMMVKSYDLILK